jgi:outer membrane immunogenic protein
MQSAGKTLFIVALLSTLANGATLADGPPRGGLKDPPAYAPYSWTGFYVGYNAGYARAAQDDARFTGDVGSGTGDVGGAGNFFLAGTITSPVSRNLSVERAGFTQGLQLGYMRQLGPALVVGLEADIQHAFIEGTGSGPGGFSGLTLAAEQDLNWFGTVRTRLGLLLGERLLVYGTGGFAYGQTEAKSHLSLAGGHSISVTVSPGTSLDCNATAGTTTCLAGSSSRTSAGWAAGLGAEWALWGSTTLKVEYLHIDLGDENIRLVAQSPATGTGFLNARFDNSYDIVRGGLNLRF